MASLFKYIVLTALAIALGIGAAYAYHNYVVTSTPENFFHDQWAETGKGPANTLDPDAPVEAVAILVGESDHDFGVLDAAAFATHDFVIRNGGQSSMNIWLKDADEGPATIDLTNEQQIINGSAEYPVTVTVDASQIEGEFSQTFTIATDEFKTPQIVLTVEGRKK